MSEVSEASKAPADTRCPLCDSQSRPTQPIHGNPMLRCSKCGFVFAADRHVPADLYDAAYGADGEYAMLVAAVKKQLEGAGSFDWAHEWVMRRLQPFGGKRILDLGCGVGSALLLAKRAGWDVYGQDVSRGALRVAEEQIGGHTFPF